MLFQCGEVVALETALLAYGGLITFLKVFRSCEFWNDYINVALWAQNSAPVIRGLWSPPVKKKTARQRRKRSLPCRKTLPDVTLLWVFLLLAGNPLGAPSRAGKLAQGHRFGYLRMPVAISVQGSLLFSKHLLSGTL